MENQENKTKRYLMQFYTCMDQMIFWDVINVSDCDGPLEYDMKAVSSAFLNLCLMDGESYCDLFRDAVNSNDDGLYVCRIRL